MDTQRERDQVGLFSSVKFRLAPSELSEKDEKQLLDSLSKCTDSTLGSVVEVLSEYSSFGTYVKPAVFESLVNHPLIRGWYVAWLMHCGEELECRKFFLNNQWIIEGEG